MRLQFSLRTTLLAFFVCMLACSFVATVYESFKVSMRYRNVEIGCRQHMGILAIALAAYRSERGMSLPAYECDASGKPMHSWRTLLTRPEHRLELDAAGYRWDEPWDGEHNRRLLSQTPRWLCCPADDGAWNHGMTSYVAVVEMKSFPAKGEKPIRTVPMIKYIVEIADSRIPWREPRDLNVEEGKVLLSDPMSYSPHKWGMHVAYPDGRLELIRPDGTVDVVKEGFK